MRWGPLVLIIISLIILLIGLLGAIDTSYLNKGYEDHVVIQHEYLDGNGEWQNNTDHWGSKFDGPQQATGFSAYGTDVEFECDNTEAETHTLEHYNNVNTDEPGSTSRYVITENSVLSQFIANGGTIEEFAQNDTDWVADGSAYQDLTIAGGVMGGVGSVWWGIRNHKRNSGKLKYVYAAYAAVMLGLFCAAMICGFIGIGNFFEAFGGHESAHLLTAVGLSITISVLWIGAMVITGCERPAEGEGEVEDRESVVQKLITLVNDQQDISEEELDNY